MQEKEQYICPECEAVALHVEGVICDTKSSQSNEGVSWGGGY